MGRAQRHLAPRRVQELLIVDLIEEDADLGAGRPRELKNRAVRFVLRLSLLLTGHIRPPGAIEPRMSSVLNATATGRSIRRWRHTFWNLAACNTDC